MSGPGTVPVGAAAVPVFVPVAVAGAPSVLFCVDPAAGDPVATWFQDHGWIDEPVQRAFLGLVRPGHRVLDLGCHLGTFSLSAAALGAHVLAVDAAPEHVRLLSLAAEANGFGELRVVHAAVADRPSTGSGPAPTVRFVARSIHGHVHDDGGENDETIEVPARTVDDLVDERRWDGLDVVKMDIEGSEVRALRGMSRLFARGCRPALVLESNAAMLDLLGSSVMELRAVLADLGYEMLLVDHLRPGVLVEIGPDTIQTESASDILALPVRPPGLGDHWRIEPPPSREHTLHRLLDAAASPAAGYRQVAADVLRAGPAWLRDTAAARAARAALDLDVDEGVRRRPTRSSLDYSDVEEPPSAGVPDGVVVWAESVAVGRVRPELERPFELAPRSDEAVLRDLSLHVDAAEPVAVLAEDASQGGLLLEAVAGSAVVLQGTLSVAGTVALVTPVGRGLDPDLTVRQNAAVFGGFLGAHVPTVEARAEEIMVAVGLEGESRTPLGRLGAEGAVRLALGVALTCVDPTLLLIGALPSLGDPDLAAWARSRAQVLRAAGTAVIQVVRDPGELFIEPAKALWIDSGAIRAAGHAPSVLEAQRLTLLGLSTAPVGPGTR